MWTWCRVASSDRRGEAEERICDIGGKASYVRSYKTWWSTFWGHGLGYGNKCMFGPEWILYLQNALGEIPLPIIDVERTNFEGKSDDIVSGNCLHHCDISGLQDFRSNAKQCVKQITDLTRPCTWLFGSDGKHLESTWLCSSNDRGNQKSHGTI